jgi:hypothetical protein
MQCRLANGPGRLSSGLIAQGGTLDLGETADLLLGQFDVADRLRRDLGDQG